VEGLRAEEHSEESLAAAPNESAQDTALVRTPSPQSTLQLDHTELTHAYAGQRREALLEPRMESPKRVVPPLLPLLIELLPVTLKKEEEAVYLQFVTMRDTDELTCTCPVASRSGVRARGRASWA